MPTLFSSALMKDNLTIFHLYCSKCLKRNPEKTKVHIHILNKKSVTGHRKPPQFPRPNVKKNKEKKKYCAGSHFIYS